MDEAQQLEKARNLLRLEAHAVEECSRRIGSSFAKAIDLIRSNQDDGKKIVLTGVGKSHYVAAKLTASFMSTGVAALFLHPAEAFHGDLGILRPGDVVLLFSKSGSTPELLSLLPYLKGRHPLIAITGQVNSPIAQASDVVLDASVQKEACPINLLPTASTTVALALGDALVAVLAECRGFSRETFAGFHPGGNLGKRLNSRVAEIFHGLEKVASGPESTPLRAVAKALTDKPLGAFCVVDAQNKLTGILTDGDIRRALARSESPELPALQFMNRKPITLALDMVLEDAVALMEQPQKKVTCAPVVSPSGELLGLVHLHDLI